MFRSHRSTLAWALLALALGCLAWPPAAGAATLDEAKKAGWVGEQPDGYLGLVRKDAPEDVKKLVSDVNTKRRSVYDGVAKKEGISLNAVAARSGERLIENAEPGEFILVGSWKKKE